MRRVLGASTTSGSASCSLGTMYMGSGRLPGYALVLATEQASSRSARYTASTTACLLTTPSGPSNSSGLREAAGLQPGEGFEAAGRFGHSSHTGRCACEVKAFWPSRPVLPFCSQTRHTAYDVNW